MKKLIYIFTGLILLVAPISGYSEVAVAPNKTVTTVQNVSAVSPLDVVKTPQKYLNQTITMNATFDKFSTLGLDYKPAMRDSQNYIGFLIKRDNVVDHTIPLSEMKLFMKRDLAEKNINLESGDKIKITGKVFSTALGDPWIDVTQISITSKVQKTTEK